MCDISVCRVLEVLSGLAVGKEEVDMERMGNIINRQMLSILNNVSSPFTLPSSLSQFLSLSLTHALFAGGVLASQLLCLCSHR